MAFCKYCGAELSEGAKFCIKCAAPVEGEAAPVVKKPMNTKLFGIVAGAVAAVVLVVILIVVLAGGNVHGSAQDVAEAYLEARYDFDAEGMLECYPDFVLEEIADREDCDVDELADEMEDSWGLAGALSSGDFRIIRSSIDDRGDDLDDLSYGIEEVMPSKDERVFEEWAKVEVEYEYYGRESSTIVWCLCLDGKWYVYAL